MNKLTRILVSIPAYNEEMNISDTVKKVLRCSKEKVDVVVINDGSKDRTGILAEGVGAIVLNHPFNLGYGVAIQTGYKYALENNYDILVQIDADGQHDPKYIDEMIRVLREGGADMVIGSRFRKKTGYKASMIRRIGMVFFNFIVNVVTGKDITDSTSGYQVYKKDVLSFLTSDFFPCDYPDADLLIMLHFAGFKITEIPMKMYESKTGKSMHGSIVKNFYYVMKMSLSIFTVLLRKFTGLSNK